MRMSGSRRHSCHAGLWARSSKALNVCCQSPHPDVQQRLARQAQGLPIIQKRTVCRHLRFVRSSSAYNSAVQFHGTIKTDSQKSAIIFPLNPIKNLIQIYEGEDSQPTRGGQGKPSPGFVTRGQNTFPRGTGTEEGLHNYVDEFLASAVRLQKSADGKVAHLEFKQAYRKLSYFLSNSLHFNFFLIFLRIISRILPRVHAGDGLL